MRFFIGAIVSSLILSPVSVLSMALDIPQANSMSQVRVKASDDTTQRQYLVATSPVGSALDKRFCIGRCSKSQKSGYQCKKKFISNHQIKKAKNAACPKIKENLQKSAFPSLHTALEFETPGPYLEWPVKRNGRYWNKWSKSRYRIVLTQDCQVVGAVIRKKDGSYTKCYYVDYNEEEED